MVKVFHITGRFPFNKNSRLKCWKFHVLSAAVFAGYGFGYCSCKRDTKERYWGQQFCQMERDISVRPTDRNDQTSQSGPSPKLVPNIPVGPNRNGLFHLLYQSKLREFWVEWRAPIDSTFGDWHTVLVSKVVDAVMSFGSLSNYHDDSNENIKKAVTSTL